MSANEYIRCHYVDDRKEQCGEWTLRRDGELCAVHKGMISPALAANGVNKSEYIGSHKEIEQSLRDRIEGKSPQESTAILREHIGGLTKLIEKLKLETSVTKAIEMEVSEKLSSEERQAIRNQYAARVPKTDAPKKDNRKLSNMTPEEQVKSFMAKHKGMTERGAKLMLGLE